MIRDFQSSKEVAESSCAFQLAPLSSLYTTSAWTTGAVVRSVRLRPDAIVCLVAIVTHESADDCVSRLLNQLGAFALFGALPRRVTRLLAIEARSLVHWQDGLLAIFQQVRACTVHTYRPILAGSLAFTLCSCLSFAFAFGCSPSKEGLHIRLFVAGEVESYSVPVGILPLISWQDVGLRSSW